MTRLTLQSRLCIIAWIPLKGRGPKSAAYLSSDTCGFLLLSVFPPGYFPQRQPGHRLRVLHPCGEKAREGKADREGTGSPAGDTQREATGAGLGEGTPSQWDTFTTLLFSSVFSIVIHTSHTINPPNLRKNGWKVRGSFLGKHHSDWRLFGLRRAWLWSKGKGVFMSVFVCVCLPWPRWETICSTYLLVMRPWPHHDIISPWLTAFLLSSQFLHLLLHFVLHPSFPPFLSFLIIPSMFVFLFFSQVPWLYQ